MQTRTGWIAGAGAVLLASIAALILFMKHGPAPDAGATAGATKSQRRDSPSVTAREEIRRQLAAATPIARGQFRNDETIGLLHRLARLDPAAAIDYAVQHPERHGQADLAAELFAGWLDRDERSARAWLDTVPAGELRVQLVPLVVSHLASEQPEAALALAGELPGYDGELEPLPASGKWDHADELEAQSREHAYAMVFREWASSDPAAAADRAGMIEDPLHRNMALQEVGAKWILKDAAAAIAWAQQLPAGPGRHSALQGILEGWTSHAPAEAAAFLGGMEAGPERTEWLRQLGENWSASDPRQAFEWAAGLPGEAERADATRSVLAKVLESDGRQAADYALTLPAGATRRQGMELVLPLWSAGDAAGVRAWLEDLPDAAVRHEAQEILSAR